MRTAGLRTDVRGSSLVEQLIILGVVALACIGAFRFLGDSVSSKAREEGDRVASLTPGEGGGDHDDDGGGGGWLGGLVDGVSGAFGGAVDWVGDRASDVGGWVSDTAWPFLRDWTPVGFHYGLLNAAWNTLGNIGHAITHPVEALEGLNYALSHPVSTLYVFGAQSWETIREHPQQGLGELTFNVGSFFIPGGGSTTAVKVATSAASYGSSTVSVSDMGSDASHADVPGWVQTIDTAVAWSNPATFGARLNYDLLHR